MSVGASYRQGHEFTAFGEQEPPSLLQQYRHCTRQNQQQLKEAKNITDLVNIKIHSLDKQLVNKDMTYNFQYDPLHFRQKVPCMGERNFLINCAVLLNGSKKPGLPFQAVKEKQKFNLGSGGMDEMSFQNLSQIEEITIHKDLEFEGIKGQKPESTLRKFVTEKETTLNADPQLQLRRESRKNDPVNMLKQLFTKEIKEHKLLDSNRVINKYKKEQLQKKSARKNRTTYAPEFGMSKHFREDVEDMIPQSRQHQVEPLPFNDELIDPNLIRDSPIHGHSKPAMKPIDRFELNKKLANLQKLFDEDKQNKVAGGSPNESVLSDEDPFVQGLREELKIQPDVRQQKNKAIKRIQSQDTSLAGNDHPEQDSDDLRIFLTNKIQDIKKHMRHDHKDFKVTQAGVKQYKASTLSKVQAVKKVGYAQLEKQYKNRFNKTGVDVDFKNAIVHYDKEQHKRTTLQHDKFQQDLTQHKRATLTGSKIYPGDENSLDALSRELHRQRQSRKIQVACVKEVKKKTENEDIKHKDILEVIKNAKQEQDEIEQREDEIKSAGEYDIQQMIYARIPETLSATGGIRTMGTIEDQEVPDVPPSQTEDVVSNREVIQLNHKETMSIKEPITIETGQGYPEADGSMENSVPQEQRFSLENVGSETQRDEADSIVRNIAAVEQIQADEDAKTELEIRNRDAAYYTETDALRIKNFEGHEVAHGAHPSSGSLKGMFFRKQDNSPQEANKALSNSQMHQSSLTFKTRPFTGAQPTTEAPFRINFGQFSPKRFNRYPRFTIVLKKEENQRNSSYIQENIVSLNPQFLTYLMEGSRPPADTAGPVTTQKQILRSDTGNSGEAERITLNQINDSKGAPKMSILENNEATPEQIYLRQQGVTMKHENDQETKKYDPFEKVILVKGIDNSILTSFRTLKRQNNVISDTMKVVHNKFQPQKHQHMFFQLSKNNNPRYLYPLTDTEDHADFTVAREIFQQNLARIEEKVSPRFLEQNETGGTTRLAEEEYQKKQAQRSMEEKYDSKDQDISIQDTSIRRDNSSKHMPTKRWDGSSTLEDDGQPGTQTNLQEVYFEGQLFKESTTLKERSKDMELTLGGRKTLVNGTRLQTAVKEDSAIESVEDNIIFDRKYSENNGRKSDLSNNQMTIHSTNQNWHIPQQEAPPQVKVPEPSNIKVSTKLKKEEVKKPVTPREAVSAGAPQRGLISGSREVGNSKNREVMQLTKIDPFEGFNSTFVSEMVGTTYTNKNRLVNTRGGETVSTIQQDSFIATAKPKIPYAMRSSQNYKGSPKLDSMHQNPHLPRVGVQTTTAKSGSRSVSQKKGTAVGRQRKLQSNFGDGQSNMFTQVTSNQFDTVSRTNANQAFAMNGFTVGSGSYERGRQVLPPLLQQMSFLEEQRTTIENGNQAFRKSGIGLPTSQNNRLKQLIDDIYVKEKRYVKQYVRDDYLGNHNSIFNLERIHKLQINTNNPVSDYESDGQFYPRTQQARQSQQMMLSNNWKKGGDSQSRMTLVRHKNLNIDMISNM